MKLGQIVDAYKALDEATVKDLSFDERMAVVNAMSAMRAAATDFDMFLKSLRDKFKTPNIEDIVSKIQMGKGLTEAEASEFMEYNTPVNKAVSAERDKEVTIEVPKIGRDTIVKLIGENGWKMKMMEVLDFCS